MIKAPPNVWMNGVMHENPYHAIPENGDHEHRAQLARRWPDH